MKNVKIVIPHYGDNKLLENLINALERNVKEIDISSDLVIIDNNVVNLGFTGAVNEGIRKSQYMEAEMIWILNNDTEPLENALMPMIELMKEKPKCGIVSSKILSKENPDFIHHGGTIRTYPNGVHKTGLESLNQLNKRTKEKYVAFCSVLLRNDMIKEIGLLDERYFLIASDSDYCYTARSRGWEVWYEPKSRVLHDIGQSQNPSPETQKIMRMDMIRFRDKWLTSRLFNELDQEVFDA